MSIVTSSASGIPDGAWPVALGVLGAIMGSFLATLAIRWPQDRSVLRGRSACDACGRTLGVAELVPLMSAVASRGRCRTCGTRIDRRHSAIELGCAAAGVIAGLAAPGWQGVAGAAFGWLLLTLAAIDAAELWLPDPLVAVLALGGLAGGSWWPPALADRLIGGALGFATLWAVAAGYRRLRGREGMGGGDSKLFGAIGLWLGWRLLPAVLVMAALVGLGVALFQHLRGRAVAGDTALPFGAFLAVAAYPTWVAMVAYAG